MLAVDFGGIYHWSQYIAAIGILLAAALAIPGLTDSTASSGLRQHAVLLPLGVLVLWAWLQSAALPAGLVAWLSPGSYAAYTQWLAGFDVGSGADAVGPGNTAASFVSLSVSPHDTAHVASVLTLMLPLCWAASVIFHARSRLMMLLSAIAIAGASVAILGLYRKLDPTADLWIFQPKPNAFGGFVNRNNAALMLNFGLAASLGLMSWRMMALHQVEVDTPEFEFNDLLALISDRESLVGLISGTTCTAGLLVNGSRGGLVAALFGMAVAFGYVRPRRGLISLPVLIVVMAISVTILITPMNLNLESLQRWEVLTGDASTLQSDGRMLHWQDGWRAAKAYLPGGAGLSAYAYAYLPYQDVSPSWWYEHADNLWLEMLVETGVVGLAVAASLLAILLIALNRLAVSVDPIDQGLRVAGWYTITAIIVSQFFDYGLVLPANLIAALLLGTAIISRDIANGGGGASGFAPAHDERPDESMDGAAAPPARFRLRLGSRRWAPGRARLFNRVGSTTLAVSVIAVAAMALPHLRQDAITDSLLSRLNDEYARWQLNPDALAKMEEVLRQRNQVDSSPLLLTRLATVQRDRAHLAEAREWRPQSDSEMRAVYQQTDLSSRSRVYPPDTSTQRRDSLSSWQHYTDAWKTSLDTLRICPLAQEPRGSLLRLFPIIASDADESPPLTRQPKLVAHAAAEQLLVFYHGNPARQFALGQASLVRGDLEAAAQGLRSAVKKSPALTSPVMKLLRDNLALDVATVIPHDSDVMQLAAAEYLQWEKIDPEFLRTATEAIRCDDGDSLESRARCEALLGQIYFVLNNVAEAQRHYQQSIRLAPKQAGHRVEFIERLLQHHLKSEALLEARRGRQTLADDPKFQQYIDQIAESERTQSVPTDTVPTIDRSQLDALLEESPR